MPSGGVHPITWKRPAQGRGSPPRGARATGLSPIDRCASVPPTPASTPFRRRAVTAALDVKTRDAKAESRAVLRPFRLPMGPAGPSLRSGPAGLAAAAGLDRRYGFLIPPPTHGRGGVRICLWANNGEPYSTWNRTTVPRPLEIVHGSSSSASVDSPASSFRASGCAKRRFISATRARASASRSSGVISR
jgi:hypothetical protein